MRIGSFLTSIFGIALAAGSVYVAKDFLNQAAGPANATVEPDTVQVVYAAEDINFGVPIEARMIGLQSWPRSALPDGAYTDPAGVLGPQGVDPRRAKAKIYKGEVLLASKLSGFGEKVTIVQKLGENTRAMAIRVDAETAVGGFVTPGDFVDVLLTTSNRGSGLQAVTILQNIRVIGVDQTSAEESTQPDIARTVTVEVTPADGQKLALAQKAGTLSLTLRTLDNVLDQPLDMIEMRDLLQQKSPVEAEEKKPVIRIRRGVEESEVSLN